MSCPGYYQPSPRAWHYTATGKSKEGYSYTYGGRTLGFDANKAELSSHIEIFDHYLEKWHRKVTTGNPPESLYGGRCCSHPTTGELYFYGGHDGRTWRGELHSFSPGSLKWCLLSHESDQPNRPMKKIACGLTCFGSRKLIVFGGYGIAQSSNLPEATYTFQTFIHGSGSLGCTNELHIFNMETAIWSSPAVKGTRPPPCSHFSFTSINDHEAIMYGGRLASGRSVNDIYLFDFSEMVITKLDHRNGPLPSERSYHAACCLGYGSEHPYLLVSGGWDNNGKTLEDAWVYNFASNSWAELDLLYPIPRQAHSATSVIIAPGLIEVTQFGGCSERSPIKSDEHQSKMSETTVWTFCRREYVDLLEDEFTVYNYSKSDWVLVRVASNHQLGSDTRIREKFERIWRISSESDRVGQPHSDERLLQQIQIAQERITQEVSRREEAERQVQLHESRANEAEADVMDMETHWVVQRQEIELTDTELGRGGWGVVKVANFRGIQVAAKCFYPQLTSDYYLSMYNREMNMASRLRHPNMVQFIGASVEGTPIILTELMTTSLRAILEHGPIELSQTASISLDVARALNYLHLMKPHPIIHRDISSANVLLDPLPNSSWKAKISDYGSVNLLARTQTVGPGSPIYAAPEAGMPALQSPKMDIYSYGVLLIEILTDQFPEVNIRRRLITAINNGSYRNLIEQCLSDEKDHRPSAQVIITRLSEIEAS